MASTTVKAGICPKCGSTNTEVVLLTNHKDRDGNGGSNIAYAICRACGFQDQNLRGDDPDILVAVARKAFSTEYVRDGRKSDGLPMVDEVAGDIQKLIRIVCAMNDRCERCPMHGSPGTPENITDEGWMLANGKLGLQCSDQDYGTLRRKLMRDYPMLPVCDARAT